MIVILVLLKIVELCKLMESRQSIFSRDKCRKKQDFDQKNRILNATYMRKLKVFGSWLMLMFSKAARF